MLESCQRAEEHTDERGSQLSILAASSIQERGTRALSLAAAERTAWDWTAASGPWSGKIVDRAMAVVIYFPTSENHQWQEAPSIASA
jgi:hypothetical protein